MQQITTTRLCDRSLSIIYFLFLFSPCIINAQYIFKDNSPLSFSIYNVAEYVDVGDKKMSLQEVMGSSKLDFVPMKNNVSDFGFTQNNFWVRFQLKNEMKSDIFYYLETGRPITDEVDFYSIDNFNNIQKFQSGDALSFKKRSIEHRKIIFKINLKAGETRQFYIHMKSDGEVLAIPLLMYSFEELMESSLFDQIVFGFFYGILFIASILYLFFFFAMREKTFLYYSLYVIFIGLLQFSIDGYFYQFITPNSGWFSLHSVLIFAFIANFLLGKYAHDFLKIREYSKIVSKTFSVLFILVLISFLGLVLLPNSIGYFYPIANGLGLILLVLIIISIIIIYVKSKKVDWFFVCGIFCLVTGFVLFILKNFSLIPVSFLTENSTKLGTGMEVIFLSLSMANLIRNLKNDREELQIVTLQKSLEMNELKSYFLSNISHELRTPLNAILSITDSISSETDSEKTKSNCDIIKYSSQSLLNSVNDILDFSKIEKGELLLEKAFFEPSKLLDQLNSSISKRAFDQGLKFEFNNSTVIPKLLDGDQTRLLQILNNVLSNAIKFTPDGLVKFDVNCENIEENKVSIQFTITDTGVGISKEKLNSIFDSFSQENINNKRKFGGLGLGLFIVKKLIDLHQGSISISSQFGVGTVCKIKLQYQIAEQIIQVPTLITEDYHDLNGKKILVVEDNAINQMVIKMITKKWKNTIVDFSNNGEEGVNRLKETPYDIILMDLQMPIMDGYEATIAIRNGEAGEHNRNIPIIAVTADVMETTKRRVKEIGMNHYLSKPLDKDYLFQTVKSLLQL